MGLLVGLCKQMLDNTYTLNSTQCDASASARMLMTSDIMCANVSIESFGRDIVNQIAEFLEGKEIVLLCATSKSMHDHLPQLSISFETKFLQSVRQARPCIYCIVCRKKIF